MFEKNANMKRYFDKFKDMDNAVLFKSEILVEHATVVMEMIDTTVTELDNADQTHAKLKKLGSSHKRRGIVAEDLKVCFFFKCF